MIEKERRICPQCGVYWSDIAAYCYTCRKLKEEGYNNENYCGCNPVNDVKFRELKGEFNKVDRLLNRVKVVSNLVSILSKDTTFSD